MISHIDAILKQIELIKKDIKDKKNIFDIFLKVIDKRQVKDPASYFYRYVSILLYLSLKLKYEIIVDDFIYLKNGHKKWFIYCNWMSKNKCDANIKIKDIITFKNFDEFSEDDNNKIKNNEIGKKITIESAKKNISNIKEKINKKSINNNRQIDLDSAKIKRDKVIKPDLDDITIF